MCNDRPVEVLEVCDRGTTVRYRDHTGKMLSAATGLVEETAIAAGDRIVVRGGYVLRVLTPDEARTIAEIYERFPSCE
ncbi:MAG TPA: hypothetical protein VLB83_01115 [Candidatus Paceibacterota bacterium]|nr:hypothetical protein [Candidatus Paceibacterota bacterium]